MKVYLAGGMKTNWREEVKEITCAWPITYLDPCDHGLVYEDQYTSWDLIAIEKCDYVFAYMEKDNPSGLGMSLEIGYAKALGIPIIFVDEKGGKYFGMARVCADVVVDNLHAGIRVLQSMAEIP